jgi:hypothetical protein
MNYFTADTAQKLFKEFAGYDFNKTVPGQLLKRIGANKIGFTKDGKTAYEARHWDAVWNEMFKLATKRNSFGNGPKPNRTSPPSLPIQPEHLLKKNPIEIVKMLKK